MPLHSAPLSSLCPASLLHTFSRNSSSLIGSKSLIENHPQRPSSISLTYPVLFIISLSLKIYNHILPSPMLTSSSQMRLKCFLMQPFLSSTSHCLPFSTTPVLLYLLSLSPALPSGLSLLSRTPCSHPPKCSPLWSYFHQAPTPLKSLWPDQQSPKANSNLCCFFSC